MLRQISLYTMAVLFITTLFACSNDPNEPLTLSTVHPGEPQSETFATETIAVKERAIDFVAEEAAVRQLIADQDAALSTHDIDATMKHWLRKNTRDVFMVQSFLGAVNIISTYRGVRDSWESTWVIMGKPRVESSIETVGIDPRGENATAKGQFNIWSGGWTGDLMVALVKDKGQWKIRAIDYGDQGLIKEIPPHTTESR